MDFIKQQLKNLKNQNGRINPDPGFVAFNRERLMNQIGNTVTPEKKSIYNMDTLWQAMQIFVPGRFAYAVVRPIAIFVLVGAIATSGWIASASATQNSLPGDLGYKVKMAVEKTQEMVVSVTGSSQEKTQMQMEFAKRRAEEIKKVTETPSKDSKEKAAVAIAGLESSIKSANENLKDTAASTPEKMIEVIQDLNAKTKEINNTLKEAQQQDGSIVVAGVKQLINDTMLTAVETVVQKKNDGALDFSNNEVKQLVKDQLNSLTDSMAVSTSTLPVVVSTTAKIIAPVDSSSTTLNVIVPTTTQAIVDQTVKTVEQTTQTAQKDLQTAQNLIDSNQLLEAIQKAKQVNDATAQIEQKVSEVKQVIENLPVTTTAPASTSLQNAKN